MCKYIYIYIIYIYLYHRHTYVFVSLCWSRSIHQSIHLSVCVCVCACVCVCLLDFVLCMFGFGGHCRFRSKANTEKYGILIQSDTAQVPRAKTLENS